MNILTKTLFGVTAIFLIAIIVLAYFGEVTFGYGLGDLYYLILVGIALFVVTIIFSKTKQFDFDKKKLSGGVISAGLLCIIFIFGRLATVDRGSEHKWDGHVFLSGSIAARERNELLQYLNELRRLDSITSTNPNDYKAFYEKGIILSKNGDFEKSIVEFENSINIKPSFGACFECAYSYSNIGQLERSLELYEKAADIDTSNAEVRQRISNFKKKY